MDIVGDRIENLEGRMEKRFKDVDGRLDSIEGRLDHLEGSMEKRFKDVDGRLDSIEGRLDYFEGRFNNSEGIRRNKTRYRLFHKIDVIAMYKHNPERGRCEWMVSTDFPKHLKALRDMGNHAKGYWTDAEKNGIPLPRRNTLQLESLRKIEKLASFYNIAIINDNQSETDATEVDLHPSNVDDFLEALADEWGLEWYDIMRIPDNEPNLLAGKKRGARFWEDRNLRRLSEVWTGYGLSFIKREPSHITGFPLYPCVVSAYQYAQEGITMPVIHLLETKQVLHSNGASVSDLPCGVFSKVWQKLNLGLGTEFLPKTPS
ncbi:hypothetical protein LOZ36_005891 [Ophidiomyces ophidiicola]|nr:hypothetical protein LOZ36_005891 [Ophidiomyces ophidiicola]